MPGQDGFRARHLKDGVLTYVWYSPEGRWIHTIRNYEEDRMPKQVKSAIKSAYDDYDIVVVYELEEPVFRDPVYYVHLKHHQHFKIVKMHGEEMEEVQSFRLQKSTE